VPALNRGSLTTVNSGASASVNAASVTLPSNTLVLLSVVVFNSTAANLRFPTISSTNGISWVEIDRQELSTSHWVVLYRACVEADTATVVTISFGGVSQTAIQAHIEWVGGSKMGGANGALSVGQKKKGTDTGTSLTLTFGSAMSNTNYGGYSVCVTNNSGVDITPRSGWTETTDLSQTNCQMNTQFRNTNDTAGGCGGGSSTFAGIAIELKTIDTPALGTTLNRGDIGNLAGPINVTGINFRAGGIYFFHSYQVSVGGGQKTVITNLPAGMSLVIARDAVGGTSRRDQIWYAICDEDALNHTITYSRSSTTTIGDWHVNLVEVRPADTAVGVVQSKFTSTTSANTPFDIVLDNPLTNRNNGMLMLVQHTNNSQTIPGWQTLYASQVDAEETSAALWRSNSDAEPSYVGANAASAIAPTRAMVFEFASDGLDEERVPGRVTRRGQHPHNYRRHGWKADREAGLYLPKGFSRDRYIQPGA
jgi:hypothetical protein